jgi:hypothetical protein
MEDDEFDYVAPREGRDTAVAASSEPASLKRTRLRPVNGVLVPSRSSERGTSGAGR